MTFRRRLVFPALVAAGVLWGTTVPLSKLALGWLAPGWLAFARFGLASAVLLVVSRPRLRAAFSPGILINGAAGYGGSVLLQNLGIERTSVMHAALLIGATPVLVAILAAVLGHSVASPAAWAGFSVSLLGVGLIAGGQGAGSSLTGDAFVLASVLASAGFTVSQARLLRGRDPIAATALQLLAAAAVALPVAVVSGHEPGSAGSPAAMLAVAGLVLAGTVLPTALFAFGQSRVPADVAGAFLNLEPLCGAALGIALFGNPVGAVLAVGGAAIVAGIGLSSYQIVREERLRRTRPAGPPPVQPVGDPSAAAAPARSSRATRQPWPPRVRRSPDWRWRPVTERSGRAGSGPRRPARNRRRGSRSGAPPAREPLLSPARGQRAAGPAGRHAPWPGIAVWKASW